MLVLTRKIGERIIIGQNVKVAVLQVHGNRVKLGVTGPPDVSIHREEVSHRITGRPSSTEQPCAGMAGPLVVPHCVKS